MNEELQYGARPDDRLIDLTQTAHKGAATIIRNRRVHDQQFSAEWIQNFLGHEPYRTTMDMYGTLSIDEMQEVAERLLD